MNGYVCLYGNQRLDIRAETTYEAIQETAKRLKVPKKKQYLISATLAEKDGKPVIHTAVN